MRLAIITSPQLPNPYADGAVRGWLNWVKDLIDRHDDLFVYFVLPKALMSKVQPERRIKWVFDGTMEPYADQEATVPPSFWEAFNIRAGRYTLDAVVTSRSALGVALGRQLWDYRLEDDMVPVVIDEAKATDFGEGHMAIKDTVLAARTLSYALSWPVFHSEWERRTALGAARRYLSGAMARQALERSAVIPITVDLDRIERLTADVQKDETFTLFFGGRLNIAKRGDELLAIYDDFLKFGRKAKVVICSPRGEERAIKALREKFPAFDFNVALTGEEFHRKARAAHVYLNASKTEGFSVGFVEQLYLGLVGVFPDAPWTRAILGDDVVGSYPFAYGSLSEAAVMLRQVYQDYGGAKAKVAHVPSLLKEKYGRPELRDGLYRHIKGIVDGRPTPPLPIQTVDLVRRSIARLERPFYLSDVYAKVAELSLAFKDTATRGQPSPWWVYKWLLKNGYRDLCDEAEPKIVEA